MRQEPITGFILHQRAYRETSRLVDFFSQEHGMLRGVLRGASSKKISKGKTAPQQFQLYKAYADGKGGLKRFSKLETPIIMPPLHGQALYAGMYANEVLIKLLATEDVMHHTFYAYHHMLLKLAKITPHTSDALEHIKLALRHLELNLLGELGYGINFQHDKCGHAFDAALSYDFTSSVGFAVNPKGYFSGDWLCAFNPEHISLADNRYLGRIFKQTLDELLEYKPLKSRELWSSLYANTHSND